MKKDLMRNEKKPAKKQGFLGAFDRRGPRCVDALWTLKETNPYVSNAYRENEITIPVFPHMMWGFFLSPVCHSVISLLF
ncbi:hypothetical protein QCB42_003740 [Salmonella enterica]|nr:hypothetical protein [Salmonella enterica]